MNKILLILLSLLVFAEGEKFEKVEGTSGEFSDIVMDSEKKWYIIKNNALYYSLDKGKTLNEIQIPSKKLVHSRLGIDKFNNIYVQDEEMTIFLIANSYNETFVFEEIILSNGKEKLISRPISFDHNSVYFATKSGIMKLLNSEIKTKFIDLPLRAKKNFTQMVAYRSTEKYFGYIYDGMFYSAGENPRHSIFEQHDFYNGKPIVQSDKIIKNMNAINDHIYCIEIMSKNKISVLLYKKESVELTTIENVDVTNIDSNRDFVIYSPKYGNKTYIYSNIDNEGILYKLEETNSFRSFKIKVASTYKLENARLLSSLLDDNEIYFGTSDGVYQLTDIQI